jgi:hypothetical protein
VTGGEEMKFIEGMLRKLIRFRIIEKLDSDTNQSRYYPQLAILGLFWLTNVNKWGDFIYFTTEEGAKNYLNNFYKEIVRKQKNSVKRVKIIPYNEGHKNGMFW